MSNNSGVYIVVDGELKLISSNAITVNNISPDKDKNITLTKDDIGLDKVGNYSIASTVDAQNGISDEKYMTPKSTKVAIKYNLQNIEDKVDSHLKDKSNPHNVIAEQIGAVTSVNGVEQVDGNVDLGNLVKSVNNKVANDKGNIDLGELATPTDVSNSKIEAVTEANNYTDSKIESLEFNGVKSVNNKLPNEEGNVDLGELATPDDIQQANEDTLNKAKQYTDEAIGDVDLGELVHSVAGVAPNVNGDVALKTENINVIKPVDLTANATEYPFGITVFYKKANFLCYPRNNSPDRRKTSGFVANFRRQSSTPFVQSVRGMSG